MDELDKLVYVTAPNVHQKIKPFCANIKFTLELDLQVSRMVRSCDSHGVRLRGFFDERD